MWTVLLTTIRKARNHCQDVDHCTTIRKGRNDCQDVECCQEDNWYYHLGIDHCQDENRCQDRDPSQNGNEHADDQDQWSTLKKNYCINDHKLTQCLITILAHEYIHDVE